MNSHNTYSRHFLATNVVCVLALAILLTIWLTFRNGTEARDVYTSWAAFLLIIAVGFEWVIYLLNQNELIFAAIGRWWEYVWLKFAGRLSMGDIRLLIDRRFARHCAFHGRGGNDSAARVIPPEPPED